MDDLERIAKLFADDLLEYVRLGGDLNNLDANDVYTIIDKEEKEETD